MNDFDTSVRDVAAASFAGISFFNKMDQPNALLTYSFCPIKNPPAET